MDIENLILLLPEISIIIGILLITLLSVLLKAQSNDTTISGVTILIIILAQALEYYLYDSQYINSNQTIFADSLCFSALGFKFNLLLSFGLLSILFWVKSDNNSNLEKRAGSEFFIFLLSLWLGTRLLAVANHFLVMYLALELTSISSYVLISYHKRQKKSIEAGLKYILYGALSTGIMLYGISLLYSPEIEYYFHTSHKLPDTFGTALALGFVLAGLAYKTAVVPFHLWAPDVYEGGNTKVVALLSVVPKIAALALLYRLNLYFNGLTSWQYLLVALGLSSLWIGNLSALNQTNYRRMLAYSGVAHTGILWLLLATQTGSGHALWFYLLIYTLMNLAAFMLGKQFANQAGGFDDMHQWKGLAKSSIDCAIAWVIIMLSLAGLPPTAGFIAKLYLLFPIWESYQQRAQPIWLVVTVSIVLATVVSLFYYLKPVIILFFKDHTGLQHTIFTKDKTSYTTYPQIYGIITAFILVILGLYGFDRLLNWAQG